LIGAGPSKTTINLHPTGPKWGSGTININAAATIRDFAIVGTTQSVTAFAAGGNRGWRITNITYTGGSTEAYFCIVAGSYGLIDNCRITGGTPTSELIFVRGPPLSWQTPSSLGGSDNVFIEDCTFGGTGYVCDANSNARLVVRYCTITGPMKVDGHGLASNTPARGVRHMEVYGNTWTTDRQYSYAMELRGGTGFIFDNTSTRLAGNSLRFILTDYGYSAAWPNFGFQLQTPLDNPVADQIGVGQDPKRAASEPMNLWNNVAAGSDWGVLFSEIPAGAIKRYRAQSGIETASFSMQAVVTADRDYFKQTVGAKFDGSSGVGRGTKAQMLAITPTRTGVGFWVTDEGEWNVSHSGPDGRLYVWSATWVRRYEPFTYPHPLRAGRN